MVTKRMSPEQVEQEIERLTHSPYVALARHEKYERERRQQYMNNLRWMEKRGKELAEQGYYSDQED